MKQVQQPIYEFLLWNSCKNNCKFCHQKANRDKYPGKFPDDEGKLRSIQLVKKFISDGQVADGSHFLFMGGELFDTVLSKATYDAFLSLAVMVANRMKEGKTGFLYLNTNLIYSDTSLLYTFLNIFFSSCLEDRIRFTTSYDIAYRYKNVGDRLLVEQNMRTLSSDYPRMSKVANCIITDKACEFLTKHPEFVSHFRSTYGFELNLIPYIRLHESMSPTRNSMLTLFSKMDEIYPGYIKRYVDSLAVHQERILWEFNNNNLAYASSKDAQCGHNENFRRVYANDNRCFICDCIKMHKSLNNVNKNNMLM